MIEDRNFLTYPGTSLEKDENYKNFKIELNDIKSSRCIYILKGKKKYELNQKYYKMWYWKDRDSEDSYLFDNDIYRISFNKIYIRIDKVALDKTKKYIKNTPENLKLIYDRITSETSEYLFSYYQDLENRKEALEAINLNPYHHFKKVGNYLLNLRSQIFDINKTWFLENTDKENQPFCLKRYNNSISYIENKSFWILSKYYNKNLILVKCSSLFSKIEFKYLKNHFSKMIDKSGNIKGHFSKRLLKITNNNKNNFIFFIFSLDERYDIKNLFNIKNCRTVLI